MFLATTSNSRFWDSEGKIVFLGEWCTRFSNRGAWQHRDYEIMPSPWHDRRKYHEAANYTNSVYENLLDKLGCYLSKIHTISPHPNFWRIILGPWLFFHIHALYDRYVHVQRSREYYGHLKTYGLPEETFIASEFLETAGFLMNDTYNLLLFTEVFKFLQYPFEVRDPLPEEIQGMKPAWVEQKKKYYTYSFEGLGRYLRYHLFRIMYRLAVDPNKTALYRPGISWLKTLALIFKSRFQLIPLELPPTWYAGQFPPIFDERREGLAVLQANDEFERFVVLCLKRYLPPLYLEGFRRTRQTALKTIGILPRRIFSVHGWSSGEFFKIIAAETASQGGTLLTAQHGGAYGTAALIPNEVHERKVTDTFFAWGWANENQRGLRNLPSPHLYKFARKKHPAAADQKNSALFITSNCSPYLARFDTVDAAKISKIYDIWRSRLLNALKPAIRSQLILRPYSDDFDRGVGAQLKEQFPEITIKNGTSLLNQLHQASVVVIDHCTTSILEILTFNVPTVLFWNPQFWEQRKEAQHPYFTSLKNAGILHSSPEEAAEHLNDIFDDSWSWWGSQKVQEARTLFVERFALTRANWMASWIEALGQK